MTLPTTGLPCGWHRCAVCGIASELDPRGVCWRCAPTTGTCAVCNQLMEYVEEDPDAPYWAHLGNPAGPEHGATPGRAAS
jgi:hypothetical protein